jgi:hypothetical protein
MKKISSSSNGSFAKSDPNKQAPEFVRQSLREPASGCFQAIRLMLSHVAPHWRKHAESA